MRLGYDVDPVLVVGLNLRGQTLDSARQVDLLQRLLATAQSTPGVNGGLAACRDHTRRSIVE